MPILTTITADLSPPGTRFEQGRKAYCLYSIHSTITASVSVLKGYLQALGLMPEFLWPRSIESKSPGQGDRKPLVEGMEKLLALPQPPDAIFAYNDMAALVAMRVCARRASRCRMRLRSSVSMILKLLLGSRQLLTTVAIDKRELYAMRSVFTQR